MRQDKLCKVRFPFLLISAAFFLVMPQLLCAQKTSERPAGLQILSKNRKMVNLEFISKEEIQDLLVIVHDSSGVTVFMDNQYRFKGNYKYTIDLKKRGEYFLEIIRDEEHYTQKIKL